MKSMNEYRKHGMKSNSHLKRNWVSRNLFSCLRCYWCESRLSWNLFSCKSHSPVKSPCLGSWFGYSKDASEAPLSHRKMVELRRRVSGNKTPLTLQFLVRVVKKDITQIPEIWIPASIAGTDIFSPSLKRDGLLLFPQKCSRRNGCVRASKEKVNHIFLLCSRFRKKVLVNSNLSGNLINGLTHPRRVRVATDKNRGINLQPKTFFDNLSAWWKPRYE
jgi:hypothetical protein